MSARFISTPLSVAENTQVGCEFVDTDGTTAQAAVTGGANDSLILALIATNADSVDADVQVFLADDDTPANVRLLGTVNVPTLAGTNGTTPSVDLLAGIAGLEKRDDGAFMLGAGQQLQVAPLAALTESSGEKLTIVPHGGNYAAVA